MNILAIIILNWNGWKDTLECLTSLIDSSYNNYKIIVIDNGSTDDSLERIRLWAQGEIPVFVGPFDNKPKVSHLKLIEYNQSEITDEKQVDNFSQSENEYDIVLIKSDSNLGFAKGNNVGIRYALQRNFGRILLLNNDTTVDATCLKELSEFLDHNRTYDVVTPKIYYYNPPDVIWNCGGKLTFTGSRKYYYNGRKDNEHSKNGIKKITFITGCALFVRANIFERYGLLTEKFFVGEEDYEFSLRMKKNKIKMITLLSAKVYHKVGASVKVAFKEHSLADAFIFYLNRFVNLKSYYLNIYWKIWRLASLGYIVPMLKIKRGIPFKNLLRFSYLLLKYSGTHACVSKDDFFQAKEILS